jgi:acetolactate synthase-1/2/3 large subunit
MTLVKVSDYVARFLVQRGIEDIFLVSGGGIMHLLDSVGRQSGLRYWCNYHEQACAIAAEAYAKYRRRPGAALVTVGPGGVNALSGVVGAWMDSVPTLILSGQVRRDLIADPAMIRQKGPQEGDVVGLARHITKSAATVMDPRDLRWELERAWHLATTGRPGPVWVELPLDIQGTMVEEDSLRPYQAPPPDPAGAAALLAGAEAAARELRRSRRPLVVAGNGLHWARAEERFLALLRRHPMPTVMPCTAKDLLWEDHPCNQGIFGVAGQRRANNALQSADLLLSLGSGLCLSKTGFNVAGFAARARKVFVDIDPGQLRHQIITPDLAVEADLGEFLEALEEALGTRPLEPDPRWAEACAEWRARHPPVEPEHRVPAAEVNTYVFMDELAERLGPEDVVIAGNGMDVVSYYQAFRVKPGQRGIFSGNWGAMGWDLPQAVGAAVAAGGRRVVLVTGDGSIQLNIQELLTIGHHRLPVCVFLFNNGGYASIRATQKAFFDGRFVGADLGSGVANPDFRLLAGAYGLDYARIDGPDQLGPGLDRILAGPLPVLCEVRVAPAQGVSPKASAFKREDGTLESRPLEDMAPFLPREEIQANLHRFDDLPGGAR